jgi:uncharacterized protein YraI
MLHSRRYREAWSVTFRSGAMRWQKPGFGGRCIQNTNYDPTKGQSMNLPRSGSDLSPGSCRRGENAGSDNCEGEQEMPMRTCIMLGTGLFVVTTGFASAATVTTANQSVLRAGPGSTFSVIAHMPAGAKVEVTDCTGGWCQVDFNGIAGFVGTRDLGTTGRIGNSPRSRAENVDRSHNRVNHPSTAERSVTRAFRSNKGSEPPAHTLTRSALPPAHP